MSDKVFCDECDNFVEDRNNKKKYQCQLPGGKDTWRSRSEPILGNPESKNKNNDCEDHKKKQEE